MLGPTHMRPGEAALLAAVLGTGAAQESLVPALMRVYAGADHVVGLDVDRDRFDKFTFRAMIDGLLEMLWKDEGAPETQLVNGQCAGSLAFYIILPRALMLPGLTSEQP